MTFEAFVRANSASLLRLAYVLCRDEHLAQDLVQDALVRAYTRWERVDAAREPLAYVRRMLVNGFLSSARRRSASEMPVEAHTMDVGIQLDSSDDVAAQDEMRRRLASLPPRARAVVVLRYWLDMSDSDIASATGMREGSVRSALSRSLAQLRLDATSNSRGGALR